VVKMIARKAIRDANQQYDLKTLSKDLEEQYKETVKSDEDDSKGERGFYAGKFSKTRCRSCGQLGHLSFKCPNKRQDQGKFNKRGGQSSNGFQGKSATPKFKGKCDNCGKIGHKKADCWALHGKPGERANVAKGKSKGPSRGDVAFSGIEFCKETNEEYVFVPVDCDSTGCSTVHPHHLVRTNMDRPRSS
jgi:Zinc knuckle